MIAHVFGQSGHTDFLVLLLAHHLHIRLERTWHGQLVESILEIVQRPHRPACGHAVKHIEQKRAGDARHRGGKGETHAAEQLGNALDGSLRVAEIHAGEALHQADERAQNTQRGQQARNELRQLGVARLVHHGILVDIFPRIAGNATHVQLSGVKQKLLPLVAQRPAQKARLAPDGTLPRRSALLQLDDRAVEKCGIS